MLWHGVSGFQLWHTQPIAQMPAVKESREAVYSYHLFIAASV